MKKIRAILVTMILSSIMAISAFAQSNPQQDYFHNPVAFSDAIQLSYVEMKEIKGEVAPFIVIGLGMGMRIAAPRIATFVLMYCLNAELKKQIVWNSLKLKNKVEKKLKTAEKHWNNRKQYAIEVKKILSYTESQLRNVALNTTLSAV